MPSIAMLALLAADANAADATRRYALLVGANDGGPGRVTLQYAHRDAEGMSEVLTELGGVSLGDRTLLLDPTPETLDTAMDGLRAQIEADDSRAEVIFYYSGHSDEEGLLLSGNHYGYPQLREALEALAADVRVAILDSCASGALIRSKGGQRVAPFLVDEANNVGGSAYITSSAADEVSQEADRIGGSYFTHYLATGMRGAADLSGDGRVTLDEAYAFAYEETLARTERTQHGPQHANRANHLSGEGNLVLTDLNLTSASLVLDEVLNGRALIRDEDGDLIAEVVKPGGRAVELGLGIGRYEITFTVPDSDRYAVAEIVLIAGASTLLDGRDLVWFDGEQAVARGDLGDPPQVALIDPTPTTRNGPRLEVVNGVPGTEGGTDTMLFGLIGARAAELDGVAVASGMIEVEGRSEGVSMAMGVVTSDELDGVQLSMGANIAQGSVRGAQLTMGANIAEGEVGGLQGSMGANISAAGVRGGQLTMGANIAAEDVAGTQLSMGYNHAGGNVKGLQGTLGANVAERRVEGLQATLGVNVADEVDGGQIAGVNVAGEVKGAQIGLINVGRRVKGTQIGLINVADDVDGVALGLLTFEKEGRHDLLFYASETDLVNVDLKLGGDYLYTVLGGGALPSQHGWVGAGYGAHAPFGDVLWMDFDALWQAYMPLTTVTETVYGQQIQFLGPFDQPPTQVARFRATLGAQLARNLAAFGGVSMSVRVPFDYPLLDVAPGIYGDVGEEVLGWPGFFAGVQF